MAIPIKRNKSKTEIVVDMKRGRSRVARAGKSLMGCLTNCFPLYSGMNLLSYGTNASPSKEKVFVYYDSTQSELGAIACRPLGNSNAGTTFMPLGDLDDIYMGADQPVPVLPSCFCHHPP